MIRRRKDQVEWLEFEQFQEFSELVHGVFLRHGGVSTAPYSSLNCGKDETTKNVASRRNLQIIQDILGLEKLIWSNQVHGDRVLSAMQASLECDGLVTTERNLGLLTAHGDCQVAFFYDPIRKAVANIHSGWRGSVKNIYGKTVDYLKLHYQSDPADLLVCIGPSLGPDRAEFVNYRSEFPKAFSQFQVRENHFDFWEISRMQLRSAGILDHHIEIAGICNFSEVKDFFSYRREKKTGRNGSVVALKR